MQRFPFQSWLNYNPLLPASDKWSTPLNSPHHDDFKKVWFVGCLTTARTTPASRWRVFQKSNNYKITVLRYGCLCVFICLGAYWGQTKQNWRLLCKHQLKKISSLNSWCNLFLKKVLIINRYSCLKIKNVAFNSLMSNL